MTKTDDYTPPEVWKWDAENGGRFASINRPIAGATMTKICQLERIPFSFIHWQRQMVSRSPLCLKNCWHLVLQTPNMMRG